MTYFRIKKNTQVLIFIASLVGFIWWGLVCKIRYNSIIHVPFSRTLIYIIFLTAIGLSLYTWIRLYIVEFRLKKISN